MNKAQLDNQTKGARPTLHAEKPDLETLKGLVERAADSLSVAARAAELRNAVVAVLLIPMKLTAKGSNSVKTQDITCQYIA
jgi:hypothetical protein